MDKKTWQIVSLLIGVVLLLLGGLVFFGYHHVEQAHNDGAGLAAKLKSESPELFVLIEDAARNLGPLQRDYVLKHDWKEKNAPLLRKAGILRLVLNSPSRGESVDLDSEGIYRYSVLLPVPTPNTGYARNACSVLAESGELDGEELSYWMEIGGDRVEVILLHRLPAKR